MIQRFVAIAMLAAAIPVTAAADELKELADVRKLADAAMQRILADDVQGAFTLFAPYWAVPPAEVEVGVSKVTDARKLAAARFGKPVGVQFIDQKTLADTLVRVQYLEKFENHFYRWQFYFYKPRTTWQFNTFNISDQLQSLPFGES